MKTSADSSIPIAAPGRVLLRGAQTSALGARVGRPRIGSRGSGRGEETPEQLRESIFDKFHEVNLPLVYDSIISWQIYSLRRSFVTLSRARLELMEGVSLLQDSQRIISEPSGSLMNFEPNPKHILPCRLPQRTHGGTAYSISTNT